MVDPVPSVPKIVPSSSTSGVKIPTKDIILYNDESTPIEVMTDLIFEEIGGQEIINIARNDIINGQNVIYQPIKNLTSLYLQYNPQNILGLQNTSNEYFKKFPIKLEDKIPTEGTGPFGEIVYIDTDTGNIIINVINLADDEQVEVEILNGGSIFNDTIYEVEN
jgi:hypothetical protein